MRSQNCGMRLIRRLAGATALTVLLLASQPVAFAADQTPNKAFTPSNPGVLQDQQFRQAFGLLADSAYVNSIRAAYEAGRLAGGSDKWGAVLTPQELGELDRRDLIQHAMWDQAFRGYLNANSSEFGGMFLDQAAGGLATVLFTKDVDTHRRQLMQLFKQPSALRVLAVQYSLAQLAALQATISADMPALRALGVTVLRVSQDVRTNAVEVGVSRLDSRTKSILWNRYRSGMLRLVQLVPPSVTDKFGYQDAPPLSGGSEIDNNAAGLICTGAFIVKNNNGGVTPWELLTAGHCGHAGDAFTQVAWPIGQVRWELFSTGGGYDAGTIPFTDAIITHRVLRTISPLVYDQITYAQTRDEDWVGEGMCQAGIASTYVCGTELTHDATIYYQAQGVTLYHQRETSFPSIPGDSGGPVYDPFNHIAIGVTSGVTTYPDGTKHEIFTHIYDATTNLGVTVKVS